jgi:gamma-glutamylcyclotransferase (GGCT)/AIG2-like uncharacterized protein YtfP
MENLFSYGTLQLESVQLKTFGRRLHGNPDMLIGYALGTVEIKDEEVVATSGATHHPIVSYTGNPADMVPGTVYQITETELANADEYEAEDYKRVLAELRSGNKCWLYVSVESD